MAAASTTQQVSKSAQIRARLSHPRVDSDGHTIENEAVLTEYISSVAAAKLPRATRWWWAAGVSRVAARGGGESQESRLFGNSQFPLSDNFARSSDNKPVGYKRRGRVSLGP